MHNLHSMRVYSWEIPCYSCLLLLLILALVNVLFLVLQPGVLVSFALKNVEEQGGSEAGEHGVDMNNPTDVSKSVDCVSDHCVSMETLDRFLFLVGLSMREPSCNILQALQPRD